MQAAAEHSLEQQLRAIEGGKYGKFPHETFEAYLGRNATGGEQGAAAISPYLQGAFIALEPRTGAVRALVGGRDFDDSKFDRATQALRQPGSTFKPIVYSAAIQNGRPPSYMVDDSPLEVPQPDGTSWAPQNYDLTFQGLMTMRRGLYLSRNLVAIRVGMELGPEVVIDEAHRFGITTPIHPYPSIYIGAEAVYPIELVAAYTAFANLGSRTTPMAITRVENAKGDVLWEPAPIVTPVLSQEEAWEMVDMMKDVVQHGTAYASVWNAGFHLPAAAKTGTTNDGNDVWFVGYTADLVAGVWMGMDRPVKIMHDAQGGRLAAPAWTSFMTEVYRRKPAPPDWPRPPGLISRDIDRTTGLLQNPYCPRAVVYTEWYISGTEPVQPCDVHSATDTAVGDTLNMQRAPTAEGGAPPVAAPAVIRARCRPAAPAAAPSAGAVVTTPVAGPHGVCRRDAQGRGIAGRSGCARARDISAHPSTGAPTTRLHLPVRHVAAGDVSVRAPPPRHRRPRLRTPPHRRRRPRHDRRLPIPRLQLGRDRPVDAALEAARLSCAQHLVGRRPAARGRHRGRARPRRAPIDLRPHHAGFHAQPGDGRRRPGLSRRRRVAGDAGSRHRRRVLLARFAVARATGGCCPPIHTSRRVTSRVPARRRSGSADQHVPGRPPRRPRRPGVHGAPRRCARAIRSRNAGRHSARTRRCSPIQLRESEPTTLWTEPLEERIVTALRRGNIAFEISNRYRAHERLIRRARESGVRLSLGSDGHTEDRVGDVAWPLAMARACGARDEDLYDPFRHGSRSGAHPERRAGSRSGAGRGALA